MNKKTAEYMKEKIKKFEFLENKINLLSNLQSEMSEFKGDINTFIIQKIAKLKQEMEEL